MEQSQAQCRRQHVPILANLEDRDDDWTGITDAAARRKRQNRLNVRAHRKRKQASKTQSTPRDATSTTTILLPHWSESLQTIISLPPTSPKTPLLPMHTPAAYTISSVTFPLSTDHLLTLVQFNVLRAGIANRKFLDTIPGLDSQLHLIFRPTDLHTFPVLSASEKASVPHTLHPTPLQTSVVHPHWIDIIPHARMRDNLICALGTFDAGRLWLDTVGGLFKGFEDGEERGLVVWGEAWDWEGWEVSEGFVERWGWVVEGCEEVVKRSRGLREGRGG